jgi:hypothetical protein
MNRAIRARTFSSRPPIATRFAPSTLGRIGPDACWCWSGHQAPARAISARSGRREPGRRASPAKRSPTPTCPSSAPLLIDDADRIGVAEAALFHLLNLARESGASLLLTAAGAPTAWGLEKADLLSRLRLAPQVTLGEPDEALARAVLVKLFHDRQLIVEPMVIDYIALRIERSLAAGRAIVAGLDREALARGRAVTRSMAAILLKDAEGET